MWFYPLWLTVQTVPILKNSGRCAVRPLGLRTPLLKVLHKQVVSQNLPEVKAHLEPVQLGMSRAGWYFQSEDFSMPGLTLFVSRLIVAMHTTNNQDVHASTPLQMNRLCAISLIFVL